VTTLVIILVVVVAVIVIAVGTFASAYNRFTRQRNAIEESWRQIDGELQRRHDLVDNLVEVTTAAARFDQQRLAQVISARTQAVAARGAGPVTQGHAEQALNGALSNFFSIAESYPDLTANQDYLLLQQRMVETEDRVAAGRQTYNGNVQAYNSRLDTFPSSMIANFGRFQKREYYEVDDPRVRAAPSLARAFDQVTPTPPIGIQPPPNPPAPGRDFR
jgi:LemA protein